MLAFLRTHNENTDKTVRDVVNSPTFKLLNFLELHALKSGNKTTNVNIKKLQFIHNVKANRSKKRKHHKN